MGFNLLNDSARVLIALITIQFPLFTAKQQRRLPIQFLTNLVTLWELDKMQWSQSSSSNVDLCFEVKLSLLLSSWLLKLPDIESISRRFIIHSIFMSSEEFNELNECD